MKLSDAVVCVNMVNCQVCGGKGYYYTRVMKRVVEAACPRCKGDVNYQEECAQLLHTSAKSCPSCTGTSLLLLSKLINQVKEGKKGRPIEDV